MGPGWPGTDLPSSRPSSPHLVPTLCHVGSSTQETSGTQFVLTVDSDWMAVFCALGGCTLRPLITKVLEKRTLTVPEAEEACATLPGCKGFGYTPGNGFWCRKILEFIGYFMRCVIHLYIYIWWWCFQTSSLGDVGPNSPAIILKIWKWFKTQFLDISETCWCFTNKLIFCVF